MTLAYAFWHWTEGDAADYEARLVRFHRALAAEPPAGFSGSSSSRVAGAPWIPCPTGYEDFYLVADFTALGVLNDAAVSASRKEPHDHAAAAAAGGSGGLYRLIAGDASRIGSEHAYWFSKPIGMSYADLSAMVSPIVGRVGGALWQRQMVLGPTPEYCLEAEKLAHLAPSLAPLALKRVRVCSPPDEFRP
jgi:hypothetical protein